MLDTSWIAEAIQQQDWEEDWDNPGMESRQVYLGTVFALLPSGKYYTPWANSNVNPCESCNGGGLTLTLKSVLSGIRNAIRWTFTRTYYTVKRGEWSPSIYRNLFYLRNDCPSCGGLGSREAYLDSLWYEDAESKLDSLGYCLESGMGDPCDLFASEYRESTS